MRRAICCCLNIVNFEIKFSPELWRLCYFCLFCWDHYHLILQGFPLISAHHLLLPLYHLVSLILSSPKTQVGDLNEFQSCHNAADSVPEGRVQRSQSYFREVTASTVSLSTSPWLCVFCFLFSDKTHCLSLHLAPLRIVRSCVLAKTAEWGAATELGWSRPFLSWGLAEHQAHTGCMP